MAPKKTTSEEISSFWSTFIAQKPTAWPATIFPPTLYASLLPDQHHDHPAKPRNAAESYDAAVAAVKDRVDRIVRDCKRINEKFTDPDFDIRGSRHDCLFSLGNSSEPPSGGLGGPTAAIAGALATLQHLGPLEDGTVTMHVSRLQRLIAEASQSGGAAPAPVDDDEDRPDPACAHRVGWIFKNPQFTCDGFSSSDIKQGSVGDCWWLSAVATVCHRADLMDRICVARDEVCGVYGFVFCRDGEWIPVVVDDYLYLRSPDFAATGGGRYDPSSAKARRYREQNQQGSEALYFSACADENETWLPLLEKAYAKAHGDYNAISGGWVGEGVEDITGGVATVIEAENVLDRSLLWQDLLNANKEFVFGLDILDSSGINNGLASMHAYSLLEAREEKGEDGKSVQLVKIRNPWGRRGGDAVGEWDGAWSDGSKEWTPYWMSKLGHSFDNDGEFWMSFQDMMTTFTNLYRTRLFDSSWTVVQEWTSVNVAWLTGYLQRKFIVDLKKSGVTVFVLSQLDGRYFEGLKGQYSFLLHFILQKEGSKPGEYICRVQPSSEMFEYHERSISCEVELEAGRYEVLPKITAMRDTDVQTVDQVIKKWAEERPEKLRQVGLSYDLAHAKAGKPEEEVAPEKKKEETKDNEVPKEGSRQIEATTHEEKEKGEQSEKVEEKEEAEKTEEKEKEAEKTEQKETSAEKGEDKQDHEEKREDKGNVPTKKEDVSSGSSAIPATSGPMDEAALKEHDDNKDKENKDEGSEADASEAGGNGDDEGGLPPWNAVCVMGLRVYSKDTEVTIALAKPKNDEEAASLAIEQLPAIEAPVDSEKPDSTAKAEETGKVEATSVGEGVKA